MTDVDATPTVDNGQLFAVSYSGQLVGVDLASRQILFVDDFASRNALAVTDGAVVVTTLDGEVRALDRNTGATLWKSEGLKYRQLSNPVTVGNTIAIGDYEGVVHFLNAQTGEVVSRLQSKGAVQTLDTQTIGNTTYLTTQTNDGQVAVWQVR